MRTLVARRGARVVGYLVDSRATNKPGFVEAGGWPWAIEALLARALADRAPDDRIPVALMRTDHVLRRVIADRLGDDFPTRIRQGGHTMVRINDPKAVWRAIGQHGTAAGRVAPGARRRDLRPPSRALGRPPRVDGPRVPDPAPDHDARPQLIACARGPPSAEPCASVRGARLPSVEAYPGVGT